MRFFRATDFAQKGVVDTSEADIHLDSVEAPVATRRNRALFFATASSGLAKVISVALNAISIPIAVRVLGADGYGLWATITSISSFLVFADFGLSNGLVPVISEANGKRDRDAAIHAVSTTFFLLLALAAVLCALVAAAGPLVPWAKILNLAHSRLAPDVNAGVVWFLVLQIANVPALVSQKVQMGYQEMHWTNSWQILGAFLSFVGVLVAAWRGLGLVHFIILFSVGPLLAQSLASYVLFSALRPWLAPRVSAFRRDCVKDLSGTGGVFVLLQLLAVLGNSTDQIILTRYLGLAAVAEYSFAQRLFSAASVIPFFLSPLWPAFGEALASGDHVWARLALRRTLWISLALAASCGAITAIMAPAISTVWVPQIQKASPLLLLGFVAMSLYIAYSGTLSVFLNNRRTIRAQVGFYAVGSFAALITKLWLVHVLGISGVLWGTVLGYGVFYAYPAWQLAQRTLNDLQWQSGLQVTPRNP